MLYNITPVTAPRMTGRDVWLNPPRECVAKYFNFRDKVKEAGIKISSGARITFILPMAKSWSRKKMADHHKQPHMQTPDIDNLLKALLDSVFENDCHIHSLYIEKRWGYKGAIIIE